MSKSAKVAMVGLGFGAEFIPIYQAHPNAEVAAICRRNEAELNQAGEQFGISKRYTSYEEVLQDPDIDYVHINSPIPDDQQSRIFVICIVFISEIWFDQKFVVFKMARFSIGKNCNLFCT